MNRVALVFQSLWQGSWCEGIQKVSKRSAPGTHKLRSQTLRLQKKIKNARIRLSKCECVTYKATCSYRLFILPLAKAAVTILIGYLLVLHKCHRCYVNQAVCNTSHSARYECKVVHLHLVVFKTLSLNGEFQNS